MDKFLSTTLRNIAWFKQTHVAGQLEMKPAFQRNIVWLNAQKSYLIDSVLKGYPIPEIYMQECVNEDGVTTYKVVDGQQRINSILEYVNESYCLDAEMSPEWAGVYFSQLPTEQRKEFFQYNFVVRILPEIQESQLREIFQRLNRNVVSLNDQELRQAVYCGPFIKTMNEISDYEEFEEMTIFTAKDIRRMLDVEFVSELTIAYLNGLQNKKTTLEKFYQLYEIEFLEEKEVKEVFRKVLCEILAIIPNITKTRWKKKTDFYSLFLVFANHKDELPLASDKRLMASSILLEFGDTITELTKRDSIDEEVNESQKLYASSVRASSDLSCRRNRDTALKTILNDVW